MQTATDGVGDGASQMLASSSAPTEAALAALLNDLGKLSKDLLLVLDDYHLFEASEVHDGMTFLLEQQPPQGTWSCDTEPTRRCRWRGCAPRVSCWRCGRPTHASRPRSPRRTSTGRMGLGLSEGDVAALGGRTEGWIAALQLAGAVRSRAASDAQRVHRWVRRRRPLHRGTTSLRRSWHASAPRSGTSPAHDLRPGAAHRPPLRRRHRRAGGTAARGRSTGPTCSSSRSTTGDSGTDTTTCSPTSFARICLRSRGDEVAGASPAGQRVVSRPKATRRRPSATLWKATTGLEPADLDGARHASDAA